MAIDEIKAFEKLTTAKFTGFSIRLATATKLALVAETIAKTIPSLNNFWLVSPKICIPSS